MKETTFRRMLRNAIMSSAAVLSIGAVGCGGVSSFSNTTEILIEDRALPTFEECKKICQQEVLSSSRSNNDIAVDNCTSERFHKDELYPRDGIRIRCDYTEYYRDTWDWTPPGVVAGRRPVAFEVDAPEIMETSQSEVGVWLAELATMEAAAVTAFEYLVKELEHYKAPEELILWAKEAVQEEIEHAEMARLMALKYGVVPQPIRPEPFILRPLVEIAIDNAAEGCVRETYGAYSAMWQVLKAKDEAFRAVSSRIVYEETRHSLLSWKIYEWLMPQLSEEEKMQIQSAQEIAIGEVRDTIQNKQPDVLIDVLGLPTPEEGKILYQKFHNDVLCPQLPWLQAV